MCASNLCIFVLCFTLYFCKCEDFDSWDTAIPRGLSSMDFNSELAEQIVGGKAVDIHDFPFMVSIQKSNRHICGGTLIDFDLVLTAAHCFLNRRTDGKDNILYKVVAGLMDIRNPDSDSVRKVSMFNIHHFNKEFYVNDIALLKLAEPFKKSLTIKLAPLAGEETSIMHRKCVTLGWSYTEDSLMRRRRQTDATNLFKDIINMRDAMEPPILRMVHITLISNNLCRRVYGNKYVNDNHICTLDSRAGKTSCKSDSGGPLLCDGLICGITSWGLGCSKTANPGVWTRVSKYKGFIWSIFNNTDYEMEYVKSNAYRTYNLSYIIVLLINTILFILHI